MFQSYDLAVVLTGIEVHAANRCGVRVAEPLGGDLLAIGEHRSTEPLEAAFRLVCKKLLPTLGLLPPRVLLVTAGTSELERRLYLGLLRQGWARQVLTLEPAAALAIAAGGGTWVADGRTGCLLCWPRALELIGMEGRALALRTTLEAEVLRQMARGVPAVTEMLDYSATGLDCLCTALEGLRSGGFLAEGLWLLRTQEAAPASVRELLRQIGLGVKEFTASDLLDGALTVLAQMSGWRWRG